MRLVVQKDDMNYHCLDTTLGIKEYSILISNTPVGEFEATFNPFT